MSRGTLRASPKKSGTFHRKAPLGGRKRTSCPRQGTAKGGNDRRDVPVVQKDRKRERKGCRIPQEDRSACSKEHLHCRKKPEKSQDTRGKKATKKPGIFPSVAVGNSLGSPPAPGSGGKSLCNFFSQKVYGAVHVWPGCRGRVRGGSVRPGPENRASVRREPGEPGPSGEKSARAGGRGRGLAPSYPHPGPDLTPVRIWPTPVRIRPGGGPNLAPYSSNLTK